jgi:endo-1,4-beta-mannosidase
VKSHSGRGGRVDRHYLAIVVSCIALSILPDIPIAQSRWNFVSRSGSQLTLAGQPFHFDGMDIYNAYKINLESALTKIGPGQEVFRAWFYQSAATTEGHRDWTALDRVVQAATAHHEKIIAVLADQWGGSTDGPDKYLSWWPAPFGGDGYKTKIWNSSDLVPYRQWVSEVVTRYRANPTIAFWQLINEGEAAKPDGTIDETTAREAVRSFADDVGGLVKSLDPNHLISLGTLPGEAGSNGPDYSYIYGSPSIDIADYHDYGSPYSPLGNTDPYNGLQVTINRAHALNKPIVVDEIGIHWTRLDIPTLNRRSQLLNDKMLAERRAGVVGSLLWCWSDHASSTRDFEFGPGDPGLNLLGHN